MPSIKFSAAKIKFLKGVRGKQVDYFDKKLAGFFLRISQDGEKSFGDMYGKSGRLRRMKLGAYPIMTLAKARKCSEMWNSDWIRPRKNKWTGAPWLSSMWL